ncbi:MAG: acyl-CoA dehydrogenase family protein, partial [Gammaproteobacteria bacterium]
MPTVHPQVQKARDLTALLAAASDENDEIRELTKPVVKGLIDGGFFTMLKAKSVGGMELKPSIFARVTEALAHADGSTGWVVCQSNGCSTTSAYLHPNIAQEIFGRPDGIVAWGPPGSPYEATPAEGGYRISGKWRFMSGSQNATWLGAHLRVAGTKETKTFLYPKSSATFHDIWHTLGLRGTASNEYSVDDLFIPHERAIYRDDPRDRRSDSPLYRFTSNQLYSIGFGGVALGIARGTMDSFLGLPREKTRRGAGKPMVENNV